MHLEYLLLVIPLWQKRSLSNQETFLGLFLSHTLPTETKSFCKQYWLEYIIYIVLLLC